MAEACWGALGAAALLAGALIGAVQLFGLHLKREAV
jgi:hypothetical protein